ncbi:MAG TPA: hypothetical protein VNJ04_04025 [Gemmatimonadaceae bacterium]|nr:hypothetical protein [Gemmatimonadaceae bacterium]
MSRRWREYLTRAHLIERQALGVGIAHERAGLLAQRVASGPAPRESLLRVGEAPDATLRAAHALLWTLAPAETPQLDAIRLLNIPAEGQCRRGAIYINPGGSYYRAAKGGDLLPLALLLHHEQHHARHGADERWALRVTLRFLKQHAPQRWDLIEEITHRLKVTEWA